MKGKDLFDSLIWMDPVSTSVFYTFIASLRSKIRNEVANTTLTHKFIRVLRDGGRLVRCYTQNIDGLEAREGLCTDLTRGRGNQARLTRKVVAKPRDEEVIAGSELDGGCEVVQLHGDLSDLRCGLCNKQTSWEDGDREDNLIKGSAPSCRACLDKNEHREGQGRRGTSVGVLRPNVVLYGEQHPCEQSIAQMTESDLKVAPDVLLIMGTSLRVHGLKVLVREFARAVHARPGGKGKVIFVNQTKAPESVWGDMIDYWVKMDCDEWVQDLKNRKQALWQKQGEPTTKRAGPSVQVSSPENEHKQSQAIPKIQRLILKGPKPPRADTTQACSLSVDANENKENNGVRKRRNLSKAPKQQTSGATSNLDPNRTPLMNLQDLSTEGEAYEQRDGIHSHCVKKYHLPTPVHWKPPFPKGLPVEPPLMGFPSYTPPNSDGSDEVSQVYSRSKRKTITNVGGAAEALSTPKKRRRGGFSIWEDSKRGEMTALPSVNEILTLDFLEKLGEPRILSGPFGAN